MTLKLLYRLTVWSSRMAYIWVPNIIPVKRPKSSDIKSKIVSSISDTGGESEPQPENSSFDYFIHSIPKVVTVTIIYFHINLRWFQRHIALQNTITDSRSAPFQWQLPKNHHISKFKHYHLLQFSTITSKLFRIFIFKVLVSFQDTKPKIFCYFRHKGSNVENRFI